ncbi:MAG: tetratricopeptide repeat protein [Anaerolineales bacterium]|nr:tetratricopeptide repeat protein [Anaerolineales bacterium]
MEEGLIRAYLFGSLVLTRDEVALPLPGGAIPRTLLAYLLLGRARHHARAMLAGMFWPEETENQARRGLTQALWQIRRTAPGLVEADGDRVNISPEAWLWVDIDEFRDTVRPYLANGISNNFTDAITDLQRAVQLYQGDLLEGVYEDWALAERERLREIYLGALDRLVSLHKSGGQYIEALRCAMTLVNVDPLRESAHREIMRLQVSLDRSTAALRQYEHCRQVLQEELGLEPEAETLALAQEIRRRSGEPDIPYLPSVVKIEAIQQAPLVGCEQERAELVALVEAALSHKGGVALVEGEPGVGKTRLLREVARDAEWRGVQVLWGHCQEMVGLPPFAPWVEALSAGLSPLRLSQLEHLVEPVWLGVLSPLVPEVAQYFPNLSAPPALEPAHERERLVNALYELLSAWGEIAPLMIILEDLHWADPDSLDVLVKLTHRSRQVCVLILGSYRGEDARSQPLVWEQIKALDSHGLRQRLLLPRLNLDAAAELIRRSLGLKQPAPAFENRIYQETDGNPLFILETLQSLHDEGLLQRGADNQWRTPWDDTTVDYAELPLPPGVERVIAHRLQHLAPTERAMLEMAAVLGASTDFRLLCHASQLDAILLLPILKTLVLRRFLVENPADYRFSHDKIRQVVYEAINLDQRFHLHRQAGEALEVQYPDRTAGLAYHFFSAQDWEKAVQYSQQAGEQAAIVYANREAVEHMTRALQASAHLSANARLEFDLRLARQSVLGRLGEREAQALDLTALESLLQTPELATPDRRAVLGLCRVDYYDSVGNYAMGIAEAEKLSKVAEAVGDLPTTVLALQKWGRLLTQRGEWEPAWACQERAYELAQAIGDCAAQAASLQLIARLYFDQGNYDKALECCKRGLELCPPDADPAIRGRLTSLIGTIFHYLADFSAALGYNQKALEVWQMMGDRSREASSLYNRSIILSDYGDYQAARDMLERVCEVSNITGDKTVEGYGYVYLGLVLEHLGQYQDAWQAYSTGLALRREVGLYAMELDPLAGLARLASAQGDHDTAVTYADQVLTRLDTDGIAGVGDPLLAYLGAYRAMLAAGQTERGLEGLKRAYTILMEFAASISDAERRRAYIHDISPGKHIWDDYQNYFEGRAARQVKVRLARVGAPGRRTLRDEEWIDVTWTIDAPEDDAIKGKALRRQHRLLRLLQEADAQGAAPTIDDLADALGTSRATVKRDLAALREAGHPVKTRGSGAL